LVPGQGADAALARDHPGDGGAQRPGGAVGSGALRGIRRELRWLAMGPQLRVLESPDAVTRTAAQWVHDRAWAAVNARRQFTLAPSGGNTPRALSRQMAAGPRLPWDRTVFCFGDERNVPPDSPESNFRMAREALIDQPFVNQSSVYRIKGELPADEAA